LLIEARTSGTPLEPDVGDLLPGDGAEAEAVDDRVAELADRPVLGWKVGCTSEHAQQLLGSPGPFPGRVYSIWESGTDLSVDQLMVEPLIEGEFAFVLGSDLAPIDRPYARDEVVDAVAAIRPSIEFAGGRFTKLIGLDLPLIVADAGSNTGLVLGSAVECAPADLDALPATEAVMTVDGAEVGRGTGADVLGDPVEALVWLANNLSGRGITLSAGHVVSTGTATQVAALPVGSTATLTLGGIGQATISLSR
jgi:2-keto-4-pentenoate hydratase